jgi:hypothetical protein
MDGTAEVRAPAGICLASFHLRKSWRQNRNLRQSVERHAAINRGQASSMLSSPRSPARALDNA